MPSNDATMRLLGDRFEATDESRPDYRIIKYRPAGFWAQVVSVRQSRDWKSARPIWSEPEVSWSSGGEPEVSWSSGGAEGVVTSIERTRSFHAALAAAIEQAEQWNADTGTPMEPPG